MTSIDLRKSDRALLVGTSGSGKSTLAEHWLTRFRADVPNARIMVVDTKPRWRAESLADGTSPRRTYARMAKGDTIRGSMALSQMADWPLVWDHDVNPSQTVIVQRIQRDWRDRSATGLATLAFAIECMERFFGTQHVRRPSLLYVDEGHDFFTSTGQARGSDVIQRCYRAGRELGLTTVTGFQRPIGMNLQLMTELNVCALFHIDYAKDVRRLYDMGWPQNVGPPSEVQEHCFRLWRKGTPTAGLYRLQKDPDQSRGLENAG